MGRVNSAEICECIGFYILYLFIKFDKLLCDLYQDEWLITIYECWGLSSKLFNEFYLNITFKTNLLI